MRNKSKDLLDIAAWAGGESKKAKSKKGQKVNRTVEVQVVPKIARMEFSGPILRSHLVKGKR